MATARERIETTTLFRERELQHEARVISHQRLDQVVVHEEGASRERVVAVPPPPEPRVLRSGRLTAADDARALEHRPQYAPSSTPTPTTVGANATAVSAPAPPPVDTEEITTQVLRRIERRAIAQRERLGLV